MSTMDAPSMLQLQQQIAALQELVQSLQQREPQPAVAVPETPAIYRQSKGLKVAPPDVLDGAVNSISLRHYYSYISDTCTFTPSAVVVPQLFSLFHLLQLRNSTGNITVVLSLSLTTTEELNRL